MPMGMLDLDNETIQYTLKRRMRKSILIRVTPECKVEVLAPKRVSNSFIEGFLQSKTSWIKKSLDAKRAVLEKRAAYQLDSLMFLGKNYPVKPYSGQELIFDGSAFCLPHAEQDCQRQMIQRWYRAQGIDILKKRVAYWAEIMHLQYQSVKLTDARRRWGSCSGKNNLNFSWRLLFASGKDIDSVVIHELAHTVFHDHSENFWKIVYAYCPDYDVSRRQLKELSEMLVIWGW